MHPYKVITAGFSSALGAAEGSIVFLPEGKHTIEASVGGKPKRVDVFVDASCLECFNQSLQQRIAENVRPFGGFDHNTGAASFLPSAFRYEPGVGLILDIEWTSAGRNAIEGRDYSYFSPTFLIGTKGAPLGLAPSGEVGSLVNDPAFRSIPRIAASNTNINNIMENHELLTTLGLIEDTTLMEDGIEVAKAALANLRESVVKAQDAEVLAATVETLKQEVADATAKLEEANAKLAEFAAAAEAEAAAAAAAAAAEKEAAVDAEIEAAVEAGRIAPKDEDAKAFWKFSLTNNSEKAQLVLASLPSIFSKSPVALAVASQAKVLKETTKDEFDTFSPAEKSEFAKAGGKIIS